MTDFQQDMADLGWGLVYILSALAMGALAVALGDWFIHVLWRAGAPVEADWPIHLGYLMGLVTVFSMIGACWRPLFSKWPWE